MAPMEHSPAFLRLVADAKTRVRETTPEEVYRRQQAGEHFHLVDVREDHEWEQGHARGALHLSKGIIERDIEKTLPDRDAEIILYCGGGFRSALAADALQNMGYRRAAPPGWGRPRAAGGPTPPRKGPRPRAGRPPPPPPPRGPPPPPPPR